MNNSYYSKGKREPERILQCSNVLSSNHSGGLYYCSKCKDIICNECLIPHLCSVFHEKNLVIKVDEVSSNGFAKFTVLQDQIQIKMPPMPSVSMTTTTTACFTGEKKDYLLQKELEAQSLFDFIKTQSLIIQENLNKYFALLKRNGGELAKENLDKEIDELDKELSLIKDKWNNISLIEQISYLEKIPMYEAKINDIKIRKEKIDQYQQEKFTDFYKETELRCLKISFNQISMSGYVSQFRKVSEIFINRIKEHIINIEKSLETSTTTCYGSELAILNKPIESKAKKLSDSMELVNININNNDSLPHSLNSSQNKPKISNSLVNEPKNVIINNANELQQNQSNSFLYTGKCLFSIKRKDNSSSIQLYVYKNQQVKSIEVKPSYFDKCQSDSDHFPFKNHKSINLGNSMIITGGSIDEVAFNKVFMITLSDDEKSIKIVPCNPMLFTRENHNLLYIPKTNTVIASSGQLSVTVERINLSSSNSKWTDMPQLNKVRANATMALLNDSSVFCIGGYDHLTLTYVNGYERLNLKNISCGWKQIILKENLAISTMGILMIKSNSALLLGGFKGGSKYLQDGLLFKEEEQTGKITIENKDNVIGNGLIFYSSPIFYQIDDHIVNFDFGHNLVLFDSLIQKAKVIVSS